MIEIGALRAAGEIVWREAQSKAVAGEPRKHVKVDVKNLLHRRLAVRQEEIDPFAAHAALTNCRGHTLPDAHQVGGCLRISIREVRGVLNRNDENVPRIDRLDIHEGGDSSISKNEASWNVACEDTTEDAVGHEFIEDGAAV
jgi:hypothetical protein